MQEKVFKCIKYLPMALFITVLLIIDTDNCDLNNYYFLKQFHLDILITSLSLIIAFVLLFFKEYSTYLRKSILFSLIILGLCESSISYLQLFNIIPSNNVDFPFTGSFYNPGPLGGFLALPICICFGYLIAIKGKFLKLIYFVFSYIFIIEVSTLSRAGWVSTIVSCGYIYFYNNPVKTKSFLRKWYLLPIGLIFVTFIFLLNINSALGRLHIWRIALRIISKEPFGVGWHNVAGAYGTEQELFFKESSHSGYASYMADGPDYMFNELIQLALAWGIPAIMLIIIVITFSLYWSKKRDYVVSALILSIITFALFSYPFQFPIFIIMLIILILCSFISIIPKTGVYNRHISGMIVILSFVFIYNSVIDYKKLYIDKQWIQARNLYSKGDYMGCCDILEKNYTHLKYNNSYLYLYGRSLRESREYNESTKIFLDLLKSCSDAVPLNIIGENYELMNQPSLASYYYKRSINRIPNRIFPYFLLANLYYKQEKNDSLLWAAERVMNKRPKIMSDAIQEMRVKTMKLIKKRNLEKDLNRK